MVKTAAARLCDSLKVGIFKYKITPKAGFVEVNQSILKIFGYTKASEFVKIKLSDLIINKKEYNNVLKTIRSGKKLDMYELACESKQKKVVWVSITARGVKEKGKTVYIEGLLQNMSSYRPSRGHNIGEDTLQAVLDGIPDAIYFKDKKNRITRVNKFYAKGFCSTKEEILGKTDFDFFPEDQARQMFSDDNNILKTGKPIVGKIEKTLLPNGSWNQVITTKIPIYDNGGSISGTMGITRDMTPHANLERAKFSSVLNALIILGRALEMRDPYTQTHARDVARIAQMIGKELKFNEDKMIAIKIAAELHDLGKIGVPLDILIKPGKLSDLEFQLIKEHTNNCYKLIKGIEFPFPLADIIYQHHERLDGSGYPQKLKGKAIRLEARILAVSDVLEAMSNHRPYRAALGVKKAIKELKEGYGIKYDKKIVDIALGLIKKNKGKPFWVES